MKNSPANITVPKVLVLAYCAAGVDGQLVEVIVDFDKLTPEMIGNVTQARYRWAA